MFLTLAAAAPSEDFSRSSARPQFVRQYRQWESRLDVVMRQEHQAGEKVNRPGKVGDSIR